MRYLFGILVLVFMGCATTHNRFVQKTQSRVGQNINDVITQIGPPMNQFKMPNGNSMYTWHNGGGTIMQTKAKPWSFTGEQQLVANTMYCDVTYTTNQNEVIIAWNLRGNQCQ